MCFQLLHSTKHWSWISLASVVSSQQLRHHTAVKVVHHLDCTVCVLTSLWRRCVFVCLGFSCTTCPQNVKVVLLPKWVVAELQEQWLEKCLSWSSSFVCVCRKWQRVKAQILGCGGEKKKKRDWLAPKSSDTWDKTIGPCWLCHVPRRWIVDVAGDVSPCLITSYLWRTLTGAWTLQDALNVISPLTEPELVLRRQITHLMKFTDDSSACRVNLFLRPPWLMLLSRQGKKPNRKCYCHIFLHIVCARM